MPDKPTVRHVSVVGPFERPSKVGELYYAAICVIDGGGPDLAGTQATGPTAEAAVEDMRRGLAERGIEWDGKFKNKVRS